MNSSPILIKNLSPRKNAHDDTGESTYIYVDESFIHSKYLAYGFLKVLLLLNQLHVIRKKEWVWIPSNSSLGTGSYPECTLLPHVPVVH